MTDKDIKSDTFYNKDNVKDLEDVLIKQELTSYIRKNQQNDNILILNGLIEINGEKSSGFFLCNISHCILT